MGWWPSTRRRHGPRRCDRRSARNARTCSAASWQGDAERLAAFQLGAAPLARGPDVVCVPAGHQQPAAPTGIVRRARLPQALAAPAGTLVRRVLRLLAEPSWQSLCLRHQPDYSAARACRIRGEHAGGRRSASRGFGAKGHPFRWCSGGDGRGGGRRSCYRTAGVASSTADRIRPAGPPAADGPARAGAVSGSVELRPDAVELQQLAEGRRQ